MKKFDVLGLGAVAVDEIILAETYPAADSKTRVLKHEKQCGGLTANALVAASRLGAKCFYAGRLGNDELSRFAIAQLKKEKVNLRFLKITTKARPANSFIIVDSQTKTRNIFSERPAIAGPADHWPTKNVILSARVLHIDHFAPKGMLRAARIAHENGIPIVADIERVSGPEIRELIQLADHLILSRKFALQFTQQNDVKDALRSLWRREKKLVAITCGKDGCWFLTGEGKSIDYQPAFEAEVVDTTGCGDVFHGAFAAALAKGRTVHEGLRFASAVAALKATRLGGQNGIPHLREVEKFLHRHPIRESPAP